MPTERPMSSVAEVQSCGAGCAVYIDSFICLYVVMRLVEIPGAGPSVTVVSLRAVLVMGAEVCHIWMNLFFPLTVV